MSKQQQPISSHVIQQLQYIGNQNFRNPYFLFMYSIKSPEGPVGSVPPEEDLYLGFASLGLRHYPLLFQMMDKFALKTIQLIIWMKKEIELLKKQLIDFSYKIQ